MQTSAGSGSRRPRADAQRNIEAILDAGMACLTADPQASVAEIAAAAKVGRVTLYGHFPSRAELIDAVLARTIDQAERMLAEVDTSGDPRAALVRLIAASWQIVDRHYKVRLAAEQELTPDRIRARHDPPMRRIRALIRRGQRDGVFRADLPASWLVATTYSVLHTASAEHLAGRLAARRVPATITATLLAAFTAPGETVVDSA